MEDLILAILVTLALAAVRMRDLLGATAALGAYSLLMALLWCRMNALDVGFTEAAVGAGISTVLMLAAVNRIGRRELGAGFSPLLRSPLRRMRERQTALAERGDRPFFSARVAALGVVALVTAALLYGARDMPAIGDADSPANRAGSVAQHYLENATKDTGAANVVTPVLGDYRGYDTMGETIVIFTAALCVVLLLRQAGRWRGPEEEGRRREKHG